MWADVRAALAFVQTHVWTKLVKRNDQRAAEEACSLFHSQACEDSNWDFFQKKTWK